MLENEKKENGYNPEDSGSENRENQIQSIDEQQEDIFAEEDVAIPEEVSSEKNENNGVQTDCEETETETQSGFSETAVQAEAGGSESENQKTASSAEENMSRQGTARESGPYSYVSPDQKAAQGSGASPQEKKHKKHMNNYAKAIACAVLCGVIVGGCIIGSYAIGKNAIPAVSVATNEEKLSTSSGSSSGSGSSSSGSGYSVAQIAEQCSSSVVAITTKGISEVQTMFGTYQQESEGSGSGVIVSETDTELLIVTNYHVIEGAEDLTVCFNDSLDSVYSAQIKGTDSANDLAVVAIPLSDISEDDLNSISIATIGDSESLQVGDEVVAIGNALGLGQSVTSGVVSALDREVTIDDTTSILLQTDAAINPGNSGGALFNIQGELIGINSAKYASATVEGMRFAIPTSTAQPIIENLMTHETRTKLTENYGCLNITAQDVSSETSQMYGVPQGVYVYSVLEGGAAANAGIQQGDIITSIGGTTLSSVSELQDELQYYAAGETVELTIQRNSGSGYEEQTLSVTLDNASQQDTAALQESAGQSGQNGSSQENFGSGSGQGNGYSFW